MNIVIVIFFIILIDILLPEGNIKQYVKVILGLFVLLAIVEPLINIKNINNYFENTYVETAAYLNEVPLSNNVEVLDLYHKEKAINIYENNIKKMIINKVSRELSIDRNNIDVQLKIENSHKNPDYGSLKHILVIILAKSNSIGIQKIKKVNIQGSKNVIYKDEKEYNFNDKAYTEDLKNSLSELLSINKNNIQVKITSENK